MLALMLIIAIVLAACGGSPATPAPAAQPAEEEAPAAQEEAPAAEEEAPTEAPAAEGAIPLSMWYHGAGNDEERAVILQIIQDFNASQDEYAVEAV
jgi:ABC-type glycerol-3-phosphate transport system substrate-binding protein